METSDHDKYYNNLHKVSFEKLIDLAEMPEEDKAVVHCDVAMKALAKIFRLGSRNDMAEGLKYYVNFLQAKNELMENSL